MYSGPYHTAPEQGRTHSDPQFGTGLSLYGSMNGALLYMTVFPWIQMDNHVP